MVNRKGKVHYTFWIALVFIVGILIFVDIALGDTFDLWPGTALGDNLNSGGIGFEDAQVFGNPSFKFFNYIFGQIPQFLIDDLENATSAAIIVVAIWALFFLAFSDIFRMFGGIFSPAVGWISAGLVAVIAANLKFVSVIAIYMLTVMAAFGSLAVLVVLASTFGLFLMFHFGLSDIREMLIMRRAEESALKAAAGGEIMASGAGVLAKLAKKAKEAAKDDGMY